MRKIAFVAILAAALFAVLSCATGPKGELQEREGGRRPEVIDHEGLAFGMEVPNWVFEDPISLGKQYPDDYVFRVEADGKDKDGTLTFLAGMQAPTEVARMVSLRVRNKFVGAQVGDKDQVETYMENVTKSLSEATITGLRQVDSYWVKLQEGRQEPYFRAVALYIVPKSEIDAAIGRALDAEASRTAAATNEEQTARERVKEVFADGMD